MNLGTLAYTITATTQPLNQKLGEAQQAMRKTDTSMKDAGKSIADSSKKMSGTAGASLGELQGGLSSISPAAGQAVGGFQKMSMAARAFQAALGPIGLAIAALGLAITALTSYFKGSVDGQEKMAKIMGYLQGIATYLKDRMIELGRWLVKAFEDPQQAIKDLWEIIKQNLINRFQGMIEMVQAGWEVISKGAKGAALAVKGIFDKSAREESKKYFAEAGQAMIDFGQAAIKAASGIDKPFDKVAGIFDEIKSKAKEVSDIDVRAIKLRQRILNESVGIAKIEAEIAEARRIANDDSESLTNQIEAQSKAMELVGQKNDMLIAQKKEELSIQLARNAAGESNIDDLEAAAKLQVDLVNLETQRNNEMRSLLRRQNTLMNQLEKYGDKTEEQINQEIKGRAEVLEMIRKAGLTEIEMLREVMAEKASIFEEGSAERLAVEEFYQDQITRLEKESEEKRLEMRMKIMDRINDSRMSDLDRAVMAMEHELSAYGLSLSDKADIAAYWEEKITDIERAELEKRMEARRQADREEHEMRMRKVEAVSMGLDIMGQINSAAMQAELDMAGDSEAKKEQIYKKYAKKRKAISLAEAVIGTAKAVVNALQTQPFLPMGPIMAGLAGAMGAAQIATIAGAKMAHGGIVPSGFPNDTYPALLTSGEAVVPPQKLPDMTGGGGEFRARIVDGGRDLIVIFEEAQRRYR